MENTKKMAYVIKYTNKDNFLSKNTSTYRIKWNEKTYKIINKY